MVSLLLVDGVVVVNGVVVGGGCCCCWCWWVLLLLVVSGVATLSGELFKDLNIFIITKEYSGSCSYFCSCSCNHSRRKKSQKNMQWCRKQQWKVGTNGRMNE